MQKALESALTELVLGAPLAANDAEAFRAFLSRHGVTDDDARALVEQGLDRLLVYRSLVRDTLEHALEVAMPRAIARLGPLFDEYFSRFLAEHGPTTHYLRDVASEFLNFCEPLWANDGRIAPYLFDLARHEALRIVVAAAPPGQAEPDAALDLDAGLRFTEAARLVHYAYAVHELPDDVDDRTLPERRETHLFVYRGPDHRVRYLALTPLAASIVDHLLRGASLRRSLLAATAQHRTELSEAVLSGTARLLADLSERGAVLGPCRERLTPDGKPS
ncbi:MAG: putative DNA-binding domain-containing protein [Pseudomonadota bacterium]|nr:MAG: DUF2063 domain-containing protein [Pseudomonadota bacterium]